MVLVFATHRHKSAMGIHVSFLSAVPLIFQSIPPICFITEYQIFLRQELTERKGCIRAQPYRSDILSIVPHASPSVTLSGN